MLTVLLQDPRASGINTKSTSHANLLNERSPKVLMLYNNFSILDYLANDVCYIFATLDFWNDVKTSLKQGSRSSSKCIRIKVETCHSAC